MIAMTLRVPRPDGLVDVGDAALVRLAVDEVLDPQTGAVLQQHIPSGVQHLITALRQAFGVQDHDLATQSLERFFGLTRGRMSLAEYNVEFETRFDEAHDRAGLVINDVAKFYLFFKNSGLSNKAIDDIKLQVQGDFTRFNDARSLALRLAPAREETSGDVFYQEDEIQSVHLQDTWNSPSSHQWYDNYETSGAYYWEDEGVWFWDPASEDYDDQYYDASGWPPDYDEYEQYEEEYADYGEQDEQAADAEETTGEPTMEEYYGNKGKGKSNEGCFKCGSKWHMARDCPTNSNHGKSSKGSKAMARARTRARVRELGVGDQATRAKAMVERTMVAASTRARARARKVSTVGTPGLLQPPLVKTAYNMFAPLPWIPLMACTADKPRSHRMSSRSTHLRMRTS